MSLGEEAEDDDVVLPRLWEEPLSETRSSGECEGFGGKGTVEAAESWVEVVLMPVEHVASHDRTFMSAFFFWKRNWVERIVRVRVGVVYLYIIQKML